jgi:S1-C subfamily serine protease
LVSPARIYLFRVQIIDVVPNSPAANAGLKEGDIIVSFNGHPIASIDDIHKALSKEVIDSKLTLAFLRDWVKMREAVVEPVESTV